MKLSIIIPVYNDTRVGLALSSVLNQHIPHELETIVIDAGSDDDTLAVLEQYRSDIDILVSEPDKGIYDGMNKGIRIATGDVIGILNADDRYADSWVLKDVVEILERGWVDVCYGNIIYENASGRRIRYWRSGPSSRLKWQLGWMPPHPGFFVKRKVYERYGVFNQELSIAGDYELMLRLLCGNQLRSVHIDRVLVHMALGGNSNGSIGTIIRAANEVRLAWKMNRLRGGLVASILKPLGKSDQYFRKPQESVVERVHRRGRNL